MSGYAKLFSDIVDSSIWREPSDVCKVWITLLALSDSDGYVRGSTGWLADKARVSFEVCKSSLEKFAEPDLRSRTPDNEGRRIEALPEGWLILNYLAFRDRLSNDPKASATRERVRRHRERYMALRNATGVTQAVSASASVSSSADKRECEGEKPPPTDFDAFWTVYPRKIGKKAAFRAWEKAKDKPALERVLSAVKAQSASREWTKDGGQFIPHPTTWLNQGRWDDAATGAIAPPAEPYWTDNNKRGLIMPAGFQPSAEEKFHYTLHKDGRSYPG